MRAVAPGIELRRPARPSCPAVRDLWLRRRRSRLPWVYVVYHPRVGGVGKPSGRGRGGRERPVPADRPVSALAPEKGGHVERRVQIEAVLLW